MAKDSIHAKNNKPSCFLYDVVQNNFHQDGPPATSYQLNQNKNHFKRPKIDSDKEDDI